ncbi:DUF1850 domain-containing protein [Nonomuraea typhae]|uniref:DUF1850 domain-containing protein n=1 Tax=Nonomuraea typhae TaxID=2603600 RepID=UPI0012F89642|nr:DUF1850 domain-containing protein [Nonomuraea typhae]
MHGLPLGGGGFALAYVHSMYRVPAAELFSVEGRRFTMRAVLSESAGVLDYYALDGVRSRTPEGLWLLRLATPVGYDRLDLIASAVGRRTLVAGGRCLPLHPAAGSAEVRLAVGVSPPGAPSGDPCYNQSFFLKIVYRATEAPATVTDDIQKPQGWPSPG